MELRGKTALITGAAGCLGTAMTHALLEGGAQVIGVDITQEKLAALRDAGVTPLACDLTDSDQVLHMLDAAYQRHPVIDILINNAGLLHSAPLVNLMDKGDAPLRQAALDWQRCLGINLSSVFYVSQCVAQRMARARTKGIIINISSVSAQGNAGQSAYAASKAGVNALTRVWAKELGVLGIRSIAIAPGYIDTPSTREAVSEAQLRDITSRVPLKRLGQPAAVVEAMRFAIANEYLNGAILEIDGGLRV